VTRLICVHGPDSTGKTTLSEALAAHFGATLVPEFGRPYCEEHGLDLVAADLIAIGRTQSAHTRGAMARTEKLVITDTDAQTTAAWSIMILGYVPEGVLDGWPVPDLYLLTGIDIPWVDDGMRYYPEPQDRRRFMAGCERVIEGAGAPVVRVEGSRELRLARAIAAIEALGAP
jgi:HTH-type transcriptional repressor of NAD biosynthesis genes